MKSPHNSIASLRWLIYTQRPGIGGLISQKGPKVSGADFGISDDVIRRVGLLRGAEAESMDVFKVRLDQVELILNRHDSATRMDRILFILDISAQPWDEYIGGEAEMCDIEYTLRVSRKMGDI